MVDYDEKFYKTERNNKSVDEFLLIEGKLKNYIKKKNWQIESKRHRFYIGFNYGLSIVFGIKWLGSKSYGLFFKVPKNIILKVRIPGHKILRYEDRWKQAIFKIDSNVKFKNFDRLFKISYDNIIKK